MPFDRNIVKTAKAIHAELGDLLGPPEDGVASPTQRVILTSLVRQTRGYIESVANQINGTYESGWYDCCSVMIRRLIETLIIEAFEAKGIADNIKNGSGEFFYLGELIDKTLAETSWNLTRNTKQALPRLKDIGDKSAHSRRYIAKRGDIQPLLADIRMVIQELLFLSGLK
jgi:hypothetical protein